MDPVRQGDYRLQKPVNVRVDNSITTDGAHIEFGKGIVDSLIGTKRRSSALPLAGIDYTPTHLHAINPIMRLILK